MSASTYVYAANNPVRYIDPTGLDVYLVNCGGYVGHTDVVVENACYGPESNPNRSTVGGGFWFERYPSSRRFQCIYLVPGAWRPWPNESRVGEIAGPDINRCDSLVVNHIPLSCEETAAAYDRLRATQASPPPYGALVNNCHDVAQSIALGPYRRCAGVSCSY